MFVQRCAIDDDSASFNITNEESNSKPAVESLGTAAISEGTSTSDVDGPTKKTVIATHQQEDMIAGKKVDAGPMFNVARRLSRKWSSGVGPRIGCVREYPTELQFQALEQVNLSPRLGPMHFDGYGPIPSPRPSPKIRLSPRIAYMGVASPRTPIAAAN